MNQQNPFFNLQHTQTMNYSTSDYSYQNYQPNVFFLPQNQNSFLESTENIETNGNLQEILMSNTNNNNIYDPRMITNNFNLQQHTQIMNYSPIDYSYQNHQPNIFVSPQNQNSFLEESPSNTNNAKNLFSNKPNNNNLNFQPITAHNLFAPQNHNLQIPKSDPYQDRLNKRNTKLRANNRNY